MAQRSREKLPSGGCRCGARSFRFGQSCPANWRSRRRKKRRFAVPGKLIGRAGPLSAAKILRCSHRFSPASRRRGSRFFRLPRNAALRPAEGELVLPFPGEKPCGPSKLTRQNGRRPFPFSVYFPAPMHPAVRPAGLPFLSTLSTLSPSCAAARPAVLFVPLHPPAPLCTALHPAFFHTPLRRLARRRG